MQYINFTYYPYEGRHKLTTLKKIQILNDYYNKYTDTHIRIPPNIMKRYGKTNKISEVVSFLASDGAAYITGQNIRVNGGITKSV